MPLPANFENPVAMATTIEAAPDAATNADAPSDQQLGSHFQPLPSAPPIAKKIPQQFSIHGTTLTDPYAWMRDPAWPNKVTNPEVIALLNQENAYAATVLGQSQPLAEQLYQEITQRIPLELKSCPVTEDGYTYYSISRRDENYSTHFRHPVGQPEKEEVILDLNAMSCDHQYFSVPDYTVSHDHRLLAYSLDTKGDERYTIHIKNLVNGEIIDNAVDDAFPGVVWDNRGEGFFYIKAEEEWRQNKVFYHHLGSPKADDILLYEETDKTFSVDIDETEQHDYLILKSRSADCAELSFLDKRLFTPQAARSSNAVLFRRIINRTDGHRAALVQNSDRFYLALNDTGSNFRLVSLAIADLLNPAYRSYKEICREEIPHDPSRYLSEVYSFKNHFAIVHQVLGLGQISVYRKSESDGHLLLHDTIKMSDPAYELEVIDMPYQTDNIRYSYSSLRRPTAIMEYDLATKSSQVVRTYPMPPSFNPDDYVVERLWVPSSANPATMVPLSLVYHKNTYAAANSPATTATATPKSSPPLILYGYGSYGMAVDPGFRISLPSLLDRGFVYAIAHIRGGDELGLQWYESAKLLSKRNTFTDFIDAADYLIAQRYTSRGSIVIHGGSAGGMLVGACLNQRPELYRAVVAEVPFVDVLNTMLDETLPLTPGEYNEWGNPTASQEYFDYILSYSPYENLHSAAYPDVFATAGLHDPRVGYWEAAKWLTKLRELNTNPQSRFILKTDMDAGHGGKSGKLDFCHELAEKYAFIINLFSGTPAATAADIAPSKDPSRSNT